MATDICVRRLTKELSALKKEPLTDPRMIVIPNESNILEMHYVIEGSPNTPYENGIYHGKLIFPKEYPLKPPSVLMITPSGRFQPNRRLCLSMSDFHPESWNPIWSISTILRGLYSFMVGTDPTLGSIDTSDVMKRKLASSSLEYNINNTPIFSRLFPEYVERYQTELIRKRDNPDPSSLTPTNAVVPTVVLSGVNGIGAGIRNHLMSVMATMAGLVAIFSIVMAMRFL
jgi:ubiquitin-conjugating enzyme E2 J2